MSSRRYPGKVLAPFRGEPLIRHVLRAAETVLPRHDVVVLTSTHITDDPLVSYLHSTGAQVFRGPLDNVLQRFLLCLQHHPSEWVLRINGDSPLLWPELIQIFVRQSAQFTGDLITTIFPRTFPRGQNAELVNAAALNSLAGEAVTPEDLEHVTPFFYRHPDRYRIMNVPSGDARLSEISLAVDTIEDLQRLECLTTDDLQRLSPPVLTTGVLS
jgi:spore coat polysaccharide biosynthesis protein SpsF